jgi:hypothetical protein
MDMRSARGLVTIAVATAFACGGAGEALDPVEPGPGATTETVPPSVPLAAVHPGEKMRFEVSLAGVLAGEASFATGDFGERDGRPTVVLSSSIRSAGALALVKDIRDEATTVLAIDGLEPLSTTATVKANPRDYTAETRFVDRVAEIEFRPAKGPTQQLRYDFAGQVAHDAHSAMATLRVWQAPTGTTQTMWVLGGRRIWKVELTLGPTEVIHTFAGNQPAIRLDGRATRAHANLTVDPSRPPRTFSVWLSDDADRVPFRVVAATELGDVLIEMVEYSRP